MRLTVPSACNQVEPARIFSGCVTAASPAKAGNGSRHMLADGKGRRSAEGNSNHFVLSVGRRFISKELFCGQYRDAAAEANPHALRRHDNPKSRQPAVGACWAARRCGMGYNGGTSRLLFRA